MYVKLIAVVVVLAALAGSHISVYFTGRSDEARASQAFAIQVHKDNVLETQRKQRFNDEVARKLNEKAIASHKSESEAKTELARLHLEGRRENVCGSDNDESGNLERRVQLISKAISDSSGLDDSNDKPCVVSSSDEIEGCYLQEIYDCAREKERFNALILEVTVE